jgi:hypothetical protein
MSYSAYIVAALNMILNCFIWGLVYIGCFFWGLVYILNELVKAPAAPPAAGAHAAGAHAAGAPTDPAAPAPTAPPIDYDAEYKKLIASNPTKCNDIIERNKWLLDRFNSEQKIIFFKAALGVKT